MRVSATPHFKRLYRLRTILLLVMLSVLLLPVMMLYFFRFYENELVQKTELELITQSAVFSAMYREFSQQSQQPAILQYTPITPQLEISRQTILPRRPIAKSVLNYPEEYFSAKNIGEKMQNILLNTQLFTLAGIRILDQNGIVVAGKHERGLSLVHIEEVQYALQGQYRSVLRERTSDEPMPPLSSLSRGTGIRVFTAFPILNNDQVLGVIYLSRTPENILKYLFKIKHKVFLLAFLLLGITVLIILFLSSRLSRPIRELIDQTQSMIRGEVDMVEVLSQPGTYELYELSSSFSTMSEILHQRSLYLEQFSAHVSHEFKTPLTSMQGTLELLEEHYDDMSIEQRNGFIGNLQGDTERLIQLINRLLQQGQADTLQLTSENTNLLHSIRQMQKDLKIEWQIDEKNLNQNVNISSAAFDSILSNLVNNSIQHNATHIQINLIKHTHHIVLKFQDNGKGISVANRSRIFMPFFTTRRDEGGTGLGLGIIESTLKTWGGEIKLGKSESGALFIIRLNLEKPVTS